MFNFVDENKYPKFCEKLRTVLLLIDLATLGGDFVTSKMLKKAAGDALDSVPDAVKKEKQWAEVEEELEILAELDRKGINAWDGGSLLSERMLRKRVANLLNDFKNFKLEVKFLDETKDAKKLNDWNERNVLGSFAAGPPPVLRFRKQVTELTWQHELWHLEDLKKWGKEKFYATPNWQHEESVWNKIWTSKNKWTEQELADSYKYFKETANKAIGKWTPNKEMEELLNKPYYKFVRYK